MRILTEEIGYVPIVPQREHMTEYLQNDFLRMVIDTYDTFYPKVGYHPPWIGYLAVYDGAVVGVGGYKGQPVNGKVEIAYGTVPEFEGLGVSSQTCRYLTQLARSYDPLLQVTARTLMSESASTSILRKNCFINIGIVNDPEDGEVWEWQYNDKMRE